MDRSGELSLRIEPVGTVRRQAGEAECAIEVRAEFTDAMLGIGPGDRLQVLYWMHRLSESDRRTLRAHPMGDPSRPKRGVFALRSPMRPNPVGSTVVEVLAVRGSELLVSGLDALDGSPVIDIKMAGKR